MPKISVIIPFYNRIDLLNEAVESVQQQTFKDFEIIIVDDGSTEKYEDPLGDERIKYFRQVNMGASAARNFGISQARGEYICFLDSDDLFMPEKLEMQLRFIEENPDALFLHTSYVQFGTPCNKLHSEECLIDSGKFTGYVYPEIIFNCPIATPTVMVKKNVFDWCKFDDKYSLGEDIILWGTIAKKIRLYGIDQALTKVRVSQTSASKVKYKQIVGNYNVFSHFLRQDDQLGICYIIKAAVYMVYIAAPDFVKLNILSPIMTFLRKICKLVRQSE